MELTGPNTHTKRRMNIMSHAAGQANASSALSAWHRVDEERATRDVAEGTAARRAAVAHSGRSRSVDKVTISVIVLRFGVR